MTKLAKDVKPFEYVDAKVPVLPAARAARPSRSRRCRSRCSVEESMKHFVTPVDFEVKVFVTEEKLGGKPIAMNWDEQGRLWVSITVDYPNELQPRGPGPRPHRDVRGHRRRRRVRQGDDVRGQAEHPDEPPALRGRRRSCIRPRTRCS